ncbi:MAG TPA: glycosyltransferase family 39 protein [Verrucomicrobiae bacterium]|nr:glycosyltransferase family 39 protein [Verrucomicrobiae bacterium]
MLTLFTFFFLLGSRALNEPDEGRYAEVAREMIESGNWLVPHFWYLPHLDKPPLTYWLVAASMKLFGQNEWAVRLPVALAGLSGVAAAWLLARSIGGARAGRWSVLILQTSLLYFAMSRMLTTDIFLTQFVAWAMYFFWRSWLSLKNASAPGRLWGWHLAGWLAVTLGFLVKGPIAVAIPLVTMVLLAFLRRKTFSQKRTLFAGLIAGLVLFLILAAPWFLAVNQRIPNTLDYMLLHQAAGHVSGNGIRGRAGFPFYFFAVLAGGLLPWTWLLGWLWRREHWRKMPEIQKDGWLLLNIWAVFTFTLFSMMHSKLPAYILPIFPAIAVMLGVRFFGEPRDEHSAAAPAWVWRCCAASPLLLLAAFPVALPPIFHVTLPRWMNWQAPIVIVMAAVIFWLAKGWARARTVAIATGIFSLLALVHEASWFETDFKGNQTFKQLGNSLRENYRAGDTVICFGVLPEGLPFYAGGVISATNRPIFAKMSPSRVPLEFPGNQQRLGGLLLSTDQAFHDSLADNNRIFVVVWDRRANAARKSAAGIQLHLISRSGEWDLFSNR